MLSQPRRRVPVRHQHATRDGDRALADVLAALASASKEEADSECAVSVRYLTPATKAAGALTPADLRVGVELLCCRYSNLSELHGRLLALVQRDGLDPRRNVIS